LASPMGFTMQVVDTGFMDADGEPVTSLVPVLDDDAVRETSRKESSKKSKFLQTFQKAWIDSGMEIATGLPYITRSAFADYFFNTTANTERTIRNQLNPYYEQNIIGYLIRSECIKPHGNGWVMVDSETSSASLLLKNG